MKMEEDYHYILINKMVEEKEIKTVQVRVMKVAVSADKKNKKKNDE